MVNDRHLKPALSRLLELSATLGKTSPITRSAASADNDSCHRRPQAIRPLPPIRPMAAIPPLPIGARAGPARWLPEPWLWCAWRTAGASFRSNQSFARPLQGERRQCARRYLQVPGGMDNPAPQIFRGPTTTYGAPNYGKWPDRGPELLSARLRSHGALAIGQAHRAGRRPPWLHLPATTRSQPAAVRTWRRPVSNARRPRPRLPVRR